MTGFFWFSKSRRPSKCVCRSVSSLSRGCLQHWEHPPVLSVWICRKLPGKQVRNCQNNPCFSKSHSKLCMLERNQGIAWWQMGSQIPEPTVTAALYGAPRHCSCFLLSSPCFSFPGGCCCLQKSKCLVCRDNRLVPWKLCP